MESVVTPSYSIPFHPKSCQFNKLHMFIVYYNRHEIFVSVSAKGALGRLHEKRSNLVKASEDVRRAVHAGHPMTATKPFDEAADVNYV